MSALAPALTPWEATLPRVHRPGPRFARVLAFAVLLHALLIAIPLHLGERPAPARAPLAVELTTPPRAEPRPTPAEPESTAPIVPEAPTPTVPETRSTAVPSPPMPAKTTPAPVERPAPTEREPADATRTLSTARLLESVRERDWRAPLLPAEEREAGPDAGRAWPRGWDRPVLAREAYLFEDAVLPEDVEILDRWQAADGAHEVVVRTPTGDTLCGRAQAWNPLDPLVEPIMMFRLCGGGGKRSFKPGVVRDER